MREPYLCDAVKRFVLLILETLPGNKGLEIYGWCIMPSHVHMIIGSKKVKLEDILRDMKKHTSLELKEAIKNNTHESRKEWIIWLMEKAGKKNGNNKDWSRKLSGATA